MADKSIQVSIACKSCKKTLKCRTQSLPEPTKKECGTQCSQSVGSYGRSAHSKKWRYDDLLIRLYNKEHLIEWLMEEKLLARSHLCPQCNTEMKLIKCEDRSDGCKWECRSQSNGKRHKVELSLRKDSWFERSNMTLEEMLKFTYWWCCDLDQKQITHELGLSGNTAVDWDNFCRELSMK